ncbi:uncharacterized protein FOMMEDRAFT_153301 [Fomitiporia mediterranea MF3/22]|uniref:uncharacterized protein n=1 Tax=Fomitiporia mediterranea (strain MF3/22) TaxID=694068 RepID=UPI00044091D1|nr:uncharacterized protein FOMMEDRAFT_153301 [Fomitiporia mediterranea MF3/22]EJD05953.1 hypothetical protein FOMMEDRAFT_153301 [Fomitiporia mediterranea MF3/22]
MAPPAPAAYDLYFTGSRAPIWDGMYVCVPRPPTFHDRLLASHHVFAFVPSSSSPQWLNEISNEQCIILGDDVEPIFYRFETPDVFMTNKRTTAGDRRCGPPRRPSPPSPALRECNLSGADHHISPFDIYRNQDEMVAIFDWSADSYLGLCTVKNRQPFPMAMLVLPGSTASARAFFLNGSKFEWRRTRDDQLGYDLYHVPQNAHGQPPVRIAFFRTVDQPTPLGPAHGFLQYTFVQPPLLLEALLALSINRWMDMNAVPAM